MNIYAFTIIAIGLMFTLYLGGVETTSSNLITFFTNDSGSWTSNTLWLFAIIAFGAFVALTSRISAGGFSYQASSESVMAAFVIGIYVFFAADLYSVIAYFNAITEDANRWIYYIVWAILAPLLAGYTISLIKFIRAAD